MTPIEVDAKLRDSTLFTIESAETGPLGTAWRLGHHSTNPDHDACLGEWIIHGPELCSIALIQHDDGRLERFEHADGRTVASRLWEIWYLALVHLRPIPGSRPYKQFPAATHELMCYTANPEVPFTPDRIQYMTPANFVVQVACATDPPIVATVAKAVTSILAGAFPIESPVAGTQLNTLWRGIIERTLEHELTGGHT